MSEYGRIGYSDSQHDTYDLIKSLHDGVLGYRRIAHHLNLKNIKTLTGKEWNGSLVFAIMKRNKQRNHRHCLRPTHRGTGGWFLYFHLCVFADPCKMEHLEKIENWNFAH